MTIYRKVLCSERLPDYCKTCIFIDKYGNSSQLSVDRKDEVYDSKNRRFITERDLLIQYTYWLEEIDLPSEEEISEKAMESTCHMAFWKCYEYILNKLK